MRTSFYVLPLVACLLGGCGKKPVAEVSLSATPAAITPTLQTAFKTGDEEARREADEVRSSLEKADLPQAFMQLNQMASNQKLTPEQQKVVLQSRAALNQQLQLRAKQGDAQATEVLQAYQSSK
jgi:hypothetical protein